MVRDSFWCHIWFPFKYPPHGAATTLRLMGIEDLLHLGEMVLHGRDFGVGGMRGIRRGRCATEAQQAGHEQNPGLVRVEIAAFNEKILLNVSQKRSRRPARDLHHDESRERCLVEHERVVPVKMSADWCHTDDTAQEGFAETTCNGRFDPRTDRIRRTWWVG